MNGRTGHTVTSKQPDIEHTRRELLNFLARQKANGSAQLDDGPTQRKLGPESTPGFSWSSLLEAGLSSWWRDHPARAGVLLLKSATEDYARRKPMQVVTVAAVAGAAVVLLKPWRLMSVTALMLTLFRSSNFTGMATSVLAQAAQSMQKKQI